MLKQLKFKSLDKLFIVSDTHFCHRIEGVWKKRGFSSPEEHDIKLIEKWNSIVPTDGKVIHLGDFMLNGSFDKCKEFLLKLNGHKFMIWGNHNSYLKDVYKEALLDNKYNNNIEVYPLVWKSNVTFVGENLNFWFNKKFFVGSHFPYRIWDYQKWFAANLSGHSHSGDKERNPNYPYNKALDCGIDNFGQPVPIEKIIDILNKKEYIKIDEHH